MNVLTDGCNGIVEWVVLALPKIDSIMVNVYRPPSCQQESFKEAINDISSAIDKLNGKLPNLIMCGDYNMPTIDWCSRVHTGGTRDTQAQIKMLFEFMDRYSLNQMISEPTRINNILDLLLTNNRDIIVDIKTHDTVISDHRIMLLQTNLVEPNRHQPRHEKVNGFDDLNFYDKNINWTHLNKKLSLVDWDTS